MSDIPGTVLGAGDIITHKGLFLSAKRSQPSFGVTHMSILMQLDVTYICIKINVNNINTP